MTTTQELIDYYKNLLIVQYNNLPKASNTIGSISKQFIADQIYTKVRDGFDIETAIGSQLDILAKYVGVRREYPGLELPKINFELPSYGDDLTDRQGMGTYDSYNDIGWGFLDYEEALKPYSLTDGELRSLIKYKIKLNSLDQTLESVDNFIFEFFDNRLTYIEVNNINVMFLMYIYTDPDPGFINLYRIVVASGNVPRPAGVKTISISSETIPENFVSMGTYSEGVGSFFVGFSTYSEQAFGDFITYV